MYPPKDNSFERTIRGLGLDVKDSKKKHRFIELRAQDKSQRTVAAELGIGVQTAKRWDNKFKEQIESLNALELEALLEKYWLTETLGHGAKIGCGAKQRRRQTGA